MDPSLAVLLEQASKRSQDKSGAPALERCTLFKMSRVTQRVDPSALEALVARPPRAALAFSHGEGVEVLPVVFRRDGEKIWIGIERGAPIADEARVPAALLVDDGRYWFELRAITWRGRLAAAPAPPSLPTAELRWFEFQIESSVSWDYGTLHEEL